MDPFVGGFWAEEDHTSRARFSRLALAHADRWVARLATPTHGLLVPRGGDLPVRSFPSGRGFVVGDLFHRTPLGLPVDDLGAFDRSAAPAAARALIDRAWGRYVAIFSDPRTGAPGVLRGPGGGLDALIWRAGGLTVVASQLEDTPIPSPETVTVDWDRLGEILRDNTGVGGPLALHGVEALEPGVLRMGGAGGEVMTLWTPARFAHGQTPAGPALHEIPSLVDGCVGAFARPGRAIIAEISGGLDSAIVASALARAPDAAVAAWLNHHGGDRQGDERPYARAVAATLGLALTELPLGEGAFDLAVLARYARGARPSLTGLDQAYDRATADLAKARGARAVITGQGGDTVFFQIPTPLILADHLLRAGPSGLFDPVAADVARWTKRSAWSVLRAAARALAGGPEAAPRPPPAFLAPALRRPLLPFARRDGAATPPAKRRQLRGLANTRLFQGACARSREVDLIHPLLSQPLVEYMLGLSSVDLTRGGQDRALVRQAFAGRLPVKVIGRRSKGVLSSHYERLLAASLPVIRPHLLEGRLAREGLLDRQRLDVMLSAEHLLWEGAAAPLLRLAAIEAWASHWA